MLGARMTALLRVESAEYGVIAAGWSSGPQTVPVDSRGVLDGRGSLGRILRTRRPVRVELRRGGRRRRRAEAPHRRPLRGRRPGRRRRSHLGRAFSRLADRRCRRPRAPRIASPSSPSSSPTRSPMPRRDRNSPSHARGSSRPAPSNAAASCATPRRRPATPHPRRHDPSARKRPRRRPARTGPAHRRRARGHARRHRGAPRARRRHPPRRSSPIAASPPPSKRSPTAPHCPFTSTFPTQRYPSSVESIAYFIAAEALTNVAKYARASTVRITAVPAAVELVLNIGGAGGATPSPTARSSACRTAWPRSKAR